MSDDKILVFERDVLGRLLDLFDAGADQPAPRPSSAPAAWDLVVEDLSGEAGAKRITGDGGSPMGAAMLQRLMVGLSERRDGLGRRRYGVRLQPRNGRDHLMDYLQERLDGLVYLRCELWEAEHPEEGSTDIHRVEILRTIYDADIVTFAVAVTHWAGVTIESFMTPTIEA